MTGWQRPPAQPLFRAAVFCDGDALTARTFPALRPVGGEGQTPAGPEGMGVMLYTPDGNLRPLEDIEADVIRLAIGHYRGRMTEVARRLGIGRSTLTASSPNWDWRRASRRKHFQLPTSQAACKWLAGQKTMIWWAVAGP
jgi:DNA-binding NtrC family response regulator